MSHAIPPHVFQTLKSHRWNCNVFGRCRKFGYPNCMRVLVDEAPKVNSCVRSSSHDTVHDPRDASTTTPTPHNAKSRFKRRWMCRERTCQTVTFLEHDERMCAPRARLGARTIRWAIRQLHFEGATIAGLARQLGTTWNTVWSHIKPCLQAASDDPARFAGVQVLGVDEHVWHHQDRRRRGPRELTGIVDLTRGEDHPTARLSGPGPRQVWHRA